MLTAETIKNLSALSGFASKKSGAIFPSLAVTNPAPQNRLVDGSSSKLQERVASVGRHGKQQEF
jgi:hypothetical protein